MRRLTLVLLAAALAACSKPQNMANGPARELMALDVQEPVQPPGIVAPAAAARPQIAYTYALGYALGDGDVARVQARHVALCNGLGARCRIASTTLTANIERRGDTMAHAVFLIDARLAGRFIARLDAASADAGGSVADRKVEGEDVTKQIVDTDARVRAKQALADRLVRLIQASNAKVGELVEAERAFADTQEELDAARQLQASLRQRVAMSEVSVDYTSSAATGPWAPVVHSVRGIGDTLATSIGVLVTVAVAALPWTLLVVLLVWIARRRGSRPRWRWRRRPPPA